MTGNAAPTEDLTAWIGRKEERTDAATQAPVSALAALLDHHGAEWPTGEVPPLGHWLYFLPQARQSEIDVDGHPKRGGFLPPIALPRRMWAGGRLQFHEPVAIGATLRRTSTILSVKQKRGASGELIFVTLRHDIEADGVLAIVEEQDLVYREATPAAPAGAQGSPASQASEGLPSDVTATVRPDPVMLFRFSALTFNSHRIHYDRDYAMNEEGYPGLVVHGPLQATLLMHHFLRSAPASSPRSFHFRAQRPLFDLDPFALKLARTQSETALWTEGPSGEASMVAGVTA